MRELMAEGLIAPGEVTTASIEDLTADDLRPFTQVHLFAGIAIWSLALRMAGWPDDRPVWTGSCPCQPFSAAGKGDGFADERHLWPAFHWLIGQARPPVVLGEQVASKDGLAWLDLVQADMEAARYAFGAVDTCAAGFGAPHIRQRLYFAGLADANREDQSGRGIFGPREGCGPRPRPSRERLEGLRADGGLADTDEPRLEGRSGVPERADQRAARPGSLVGSGRPCATNGLWRTADWLLCRDEKWRPVESGTFPLADGGTFRNRVAELRGAGNAINLAQAVGFIEAVMDYTEAEDLLA
jgi:DNA (cytosine-5)-methyltransferase 1